MKYKYMILSIIVTVFFTTTAFAQKWVTEKPYSQWGREDALRLITDSPWAKPYQSTRGASGADAANSVRLQNQSVTRGGSDPRSVSRDFGPPPITVRLHSALPLREALVRLQQIAANYDKMPEAEKAAFDQQKKGFLGCAICKDFYVVTIAKAADASRQTVEEGIFAGFTKADLVGNVKLVSDAGDERPLVEFNPPRSPTDFAVFYFKRSDGNGKPFLTTESKSFKLVFSAELLGPTNRFAYLLPRTLEFNVSKLVVGDQLLF